MFRPSKFASLFAMITLLSLAASTAQARDNRLLLPMLEVLEQPAVQSAVKGIALHFGEQLPDYAREDISRGGRALGNFRTYDYARPMINNPFGETSLRSDAETCREAFKNTLLDLVRRAQGAGANALVQIISSYRGADLAEHDLYECHAGNASAVVELHGNAYRLPSESVQRLHTLPHRPARPAPARPAYLESMTR